MADVDETKVGKTGVGSGDQLSEGEKLFKGKVTPAPVSKTERLLAKGSALAKQNLDRHQEEMDAQGAAEQGVAGTDSHFQTPFRHIENRESAKGK